MGGVREDVSFGKLALHAYVFVCVLCCFIQGFRCEAIVMGMTQIINSATLKCSLSRSLFLSHKLKNCWIHTINTFSFLNAQTHKIHLPNPQIPNKH